MKIVCVFKGLEHREKRSQWIEIRRNRLEKSVSNRQISRRCKEIYCLVFIAYNDFSLEVLIDFFCVN